MTEPIALAVQVNEILSKYIFIHDDIFKLSIRKLIPIPGIFKKIDFKTHYKNLGKLSKELIKINFKIIITGIAAEGLSKDFLGHKINESFLNKIKDLHIHHGGEGGEYESLVLDCPLFKKRLKIKKAKIEMENDCTGKFIVEDAILVNK